MSSQHDLPGYWRFFWLFFIRPVHLRRDLEACGVKNFLRGSWWPWNSSGEKIADSRYFKRLLFVLAIVSPLGTLGMLLYLEVVGFVFDYLDFTIGFLVGLGLGLLVGGLEGALLGIAGSAWGGVVLGLVYGVSDDPYLYYSGARFLVGYGLVLGVGLRTYFGIAKACSASSGLGFGLACPIGFFGGTTELGLFLVAYYDIPGYFKNVAVQTCLWFWQRNFLQVSLQVSPIFDSDVGVLPLPFVVAHIEDTAKYDLLLARRAIDVCLSVSGHAWVARRVRLRLEVGELCDVARNEKFAGFVSGETHWLSNESSLVGEFRQVARYLAACQAARLSRHQVKHLASADRILNGPNIHSLLDNKAHLVPAFFVWRAKHKDFLDEALQASAYQISNPFRNTEPLTPNLGAEVFRGREPTIRTLETLLADPQTSTSIALLSPRRCGKTSLLKMLPALLPDTVCIFFDLQDNPADTPAGFFAALARQTQEQARRHRQLDLPGLPMGASSRPFEAASQWLTALEQTPDDRRILLAIDEFERLETLFPGDRNVLLKVMGLFRATIQHRRKVRLLVAGEAPFDELDSLWTDHLINLAEVRFDHLTPEVAHDLVRRPIPDFPDRAIPDEVATRIVERTGAQPFLVQSYAYYLVQRLNARNDVDPTTRSATFNDLEAVEEEVLSRATSYFRNTWQRAPKPACEALASLAVGEQPELRREARRWLRRRALIDAEGKLTIPVLGRWVREEEL